MRLDITCLLLIIWYPEKGTFKVFFSQKKMVCIVRKYHTTPNWGTFFKITSSYSAKIVKVRKDQEKSWIGWRRQWHPTPVLLHGKSHGWRSVVGYSPWGREESDTTERLHFHFSLSCTGEGNGNPLQYSCLENPRDREAWWAAVYGVAQSRIRLKQVSSSSNILDWRKTQGTDKERQSDPECHPGQG